MTVAHHFGPSPAHVGGMETVLRVFAEHRIGADSVVVHPTWVSHARRVTLRCSLAAVRVILTLDRGTIAHFHLSERGSFYREGGLMMMAARRGLKTVATIHGADFLEWSTGASWLVKPVLRSARVITCLSPEVRDVVRSLAPSSVVELMPNPVVPDDSASPADQTEELAVFAGEVGTRKGADVLSRAWPAVRAARPQARCVMVGPAGDFAVPAETGIEVRPATGPDGVRTLLRAARVVVLPSRAEGMPMILLEALGAGRPFVSTPIGGIPDLAASGGVLVPVGDAEGLSNELVALLSDPNAARALGERGRDYCRRTRSPGVLDATLRALYAAA